METVKKAGIVIGASGMLATAVALFADDVVAVGILLEAISLLRETFSGGCDA